MNGKNVALLVGFLGSVCDGRRRSRFIHSPLPVSLAWEVIAAIVACVVYLRHIAASRLRVIC